MAVKGPQTESAGETSTRPLVHIVGPHRLQNELLSWFIRSEVGLSCLQGPEYSEPSFEPDADPPLVLLDCLNAVTLPLWAAGIEAKDPKNGGAYLALFNVGKDRKLTREAMSRGMRGVFYDTMPLPIIAKGIRAILSGELWYSRETLTTFLLEPESEPTLPEQVARTLTPREREILLRIAAGSSNQEIAEDLFISLHTVKSHIYNIFKKIDVPNRLQAALWVAKYL